MEVERLGLQVDQKNGRRRGDNVKFKPKFKSLTLDVAAYKRFLNQYMEDWLKQAGREWLQATVQTIIPHWSGASKATFETIAQALGTNITYGTQKSIKDRRPLGASAGAGSGLELDGDAGRWYMRYHSTLRYLTYNEYNKAVYGQAPNVFSRKGIPNTPYNFQVAGAAAFMNLAKYAELPNPFKYLKGTKI